MAGLKGASKIASVTVRKNLPKLQNNTLAENKLITPHIPSVTEKELLK